MDWIRRLLGRDAQSDARSHGAPAPPPVRRARDEPTTFIARPPQPAPQPAPPPEPVVERTEAVPIAAPVAEERTAAVPVAEATEERPVAAEPDGAAGAGAGDPDATLFLEVPPAGDDSDATLVLDVPSRVVARLVAIKGELEGEQFELRDGENRLGRSPESDVVLPSMWISRNHAVVLCSGGRLELTPLTDKITSVDGQPATEGVELTDGATIQLGGTVFRLEVEG